MTTKYTFEVKEYKELVRLVAEKIENGEVVEYKVHWYPIAEAQSAIQQLWRSLPNVFETDEAHNIRFHKRQNVV